MRKGHMAFPLLVLLAAAWAQYKNDPALVSIAGAFGAKCVISVSAARMGGQTYFRASRINAAIGSLFGVKPESGRCYAPGTVFPAPTKNTYEGHALVRTVRTEANPWLEGIGFGTPGHTSTIGEMFTECKPEDWGFCGGCSDCTCAGNCTIKMPPGPGRYRLVVVTKHLGEIEKTEIVGEVTISESCQNASPDTEVELIPPAGYDNWLPQADEDEHTRGNYIDVEVVAHKKGDPNAPPPKKVLRYKIELQDTSKEKGVDLNWPPNSPEPADFDMKIDKDNPLVRVVDDKGQAAKADQPDLTDFSVTVNSYDWGGYTKLRVTAELEDNSPVVAHVRGHSDQDSLAIPKDDNSNHIADCWERLFEIKNTDASADDDDKPKSDGPDGDSIKLYDEYRGFHIQGQHEFLSPEIKDLFVWDQDKLGVGVYRVTGVNIHVIKENERTTGGASKNKNIVTPNGSHGDVCALWLKKGPLENGVIGETVGANDVPCNIESTTIDEAAAKAIFGAEWQAYVQSSIAHELSHATNVKHHGPNELDYAIGDARCREPDGTVTRYTCTRRAPDKNGKPSGPVQPADDCFEVAVKGGKYSGNDQCWMRYDKTNFYEDPTGACEWQHNGRTVYGSLYGQDPPGMHICESQEGTGVNDPNKHPNKAGNATYGKCKQQLRLK